VNTVYKAKRKKSEIIKEESSMIHISKRNHILLFWLRLFLVHRPSWIHSQHHSREKVAVKTCGILLFRRGEN